MWTRKELKDKAKVSLKGNYWKAVLVGVLLMLVSGGMGGAFSSSGSMPGSMMPDYDNETTYEEYAYPYDYDDYWDDYADYLDYYYEGEYEDGLESYLQSEEEYSDGTTVKATADSGEDVNAMEAESPYTDAYTISMTSSPEPGPVAMVLIGLGIFLVVLLAIAIVLALDAFILNPIVVGSQRFFLRNLNQKAEVKEVAYAFDHNYLETAKTMFLRDIFIMLWTLLFIIPGIVKAYEYRMIPYLLADNPDMTKDAAFAESKRMMTGNKWKAFVLDLSFLGWNILSVFTLGILSVFYVAPYQSLTNAALYEKLRYGLPEGTDTAAFTPQATAAPAAPVVAMASEPYPTPEPAAPHFADSETAAQAAPAAPVAAATLEPTPAADEPAELAEPETSSVATDSTVPVAPYAQPGAETNGDDSETPAL